RKRKRGSSGPFVVTTNDLEAFMEDGPLPRSGVHLRQQDLLQDLRNSLGSYTVRPVGVIEKTHRFRSKAPPWNYNYKSYHERDQERLCPNEV
ncbi:tau 95 subunit of transcription factor TFIIIC, partial [Cryomyces antarcticus]